MAVPDEIKYAGFLGKRYTAQVIEDVESRPGCWNVLTIGIFDQGELIGSYQRNYSALYNTFYPFRANSKDLALYSPDYTGTRVLELPSCRDLGGEVGEANGFCPVDFFVPWRRSYRFEDSDDNLWFINGDNCFDNSWFSDSGENPPLLNDVEYLPHGFVAGCVWGDDSSWKIQHLDLSKADQGIISRSERFGHIHLPNGLNLKDVIHMSEDLPMVNIAHAEWWDLTGTKMEW